MEFITFADLIPIIPEIIILLTACTVLIVDLFTPKKDRAFTLAVTTIIGLLLAMFSETQLHGKDISGFYGTVVADDFSVLFALESVCHLHKVSHTDGNNALRPWQIGQVVAWGD